MSAAAPGSPVARFADELLRGQGPLSEWRGAAGAVHDFVSGICISAEKVDLTVEELVVVLHRRLDELGLAGSGATARTILGSLRAA